MGKVNHHPPVKFFSAVLFDRGLDSKTIEEELVTTIGDIEIVSDRFSFSHTEYYAEEMGTKLEKYLVVFEELKSPLFLSKIKLITNQIELKFAHADGRRSINLDPGYISEAKIILATTKNFDHRVYVGEGIYADVQLRLRKGIYTENEWTYPDYRLSWVKDFFMVNRKQYFEQLKDIPKSQIY